MRDKDIDLAVRKVLDHVLSKGSYFEGDILVLRNLALRQRYELQEEIKVLLNINEYEE